MQLAVSILGLKESFKERIELLNETTADYFHLDIMDGKFVPNETWDLALLRSLKEVIKKPLDIHLMVSDVDRYIETYQTFAPEYMTFHLEATNTPLKWIEKIKKMNIKVGISIKPETDIEELFPYLDQVDLILLMSVEPGRGGQSFLNTTIEKLDGLAHLRNQYHYDFLIEVDGGINPSTMANCHLADLVVVGSFITNSSDYQKAIDDLHLLR